jgi:hypothetical protein
LPGTSPWANTPPPPPGYNRTGQVSLNTPVKN